MPKSDGWKNLKLGGGWNKGRDSRIELVCKNCGTKSRGKNNI